MGNYLTAPSGTNTTVIPLNVTKVTLIPNIEISGASSVAKEEQNVIAKDFANVEVNIPSGITINTSLAQEILSKLTLSTTNDASIVEQVSEVNGEVEVKPTTAEEPEPIVAEEPKPTVVEEEKILEVPLPTGPKSNKKKKGKKHH